MKRVPLIVSFLLFIALCASMAYWGLQLFKPPTRPVAAPPRMARADVSPDDAAALFGGRAGKVAVASNYQLKGVVLSGTAGDSIAILSADSKPAQAVAVGMEVVPGVSVKEVHRDYVLLSEGGAIKRVDLPENAKLQVNLASAAPVGVQGGASSAAQPARGLPAPPPVSPAPATTPAAAPAQPVTSNPRSPLLPPPAPQGAQQGQTPAPAQNQGQTVPAIPPSVVVSPPSAQTAAPAAAPAPQAAGMAPAPTAGFAAPPGPATAAAPATAPSGATGATGATGASGTAGMSAGGGEMLPPPSLQSR